MPFTFPTNKVCLVERSCAVLRPGNEKGIEMRTLIFVALLALTSCGNDPEPTPWVKPESTVLGCEDYQSIAIESGVLYNNVWNKHADKSGSGVQCLESKEVDGIVQYGWSWSWPEGQKVIYAYPQIKIGSSPWAPKPNFDDRFPAKISSMQTLKIAFDVETTTNGIHNLAASMWLTKEPIQGGEPDPSVIVAEVMVWTYSTKGHFNPAGKKFAEIQLGGAAWEVWVDRNWKDVSGVNENRWTYITYRSTQHSLSANIDLLKLLEYAVEQQLITADLYVADLELGNEIMSGSGVTWVKSFDVIVN
jgi:hypothetical protein